jgi:hypothetical protein
MVHGIVTAEGWHGHTTTSPLSRAPYLIYMPVSLEVTPL